MSFVLVRFAAAAIEPRLCTRVSGEVFRSFRPEQLAGDKLDGRSDIYSLGLVAFNCLTGLLPFPSETAQEAMIMRLTDHPKTLAEMKPDIDWPPELQAVMDKVLARDADERYQKSAEFGRDMAKAVENMPAAVAAAAGTMVMGAPAAAADVPKTRMAPRGGATAKIETPSPIATVPAPAKKSPVMMIVAAAVVIAGIGGAVVFMKPGSTAPAAKSDAPAGNAGAAADPSKTAAPQNDTKQGGTKAAPVQQMGKSLSQGPATSPAPAPPADAPSAVVDRWLSIVSDPNASAQDGTKALAEINPIVSKLTGQDKSNAVYAQMFAYGLEGSDVQMCRAAKDVIASDGKENHKMTAKAAMEARQCK